MVDPLPTEFWLVLSEQCLARSVLYQLCLTSRTLNHIFTPGLYRRISLRYTSRRLRAKYDVLQQLSRMAWDTHLQHVQSLDVGYIGGAGRAAFFDCLDNMRNLTSVDFEYGPEQLL